MIRILSTLAVQGALPALIADYQRFTGIAVNCDFAPTNGLISRIAAGQDADVAILTRAAFDDLAARGVILPDSIADIALSDVGVAVKAGAAKPDITTVDALRATLLAANSIAYSKIGASGVFFAALIQRMGIVGPVNAKATIIPTGFTAELVVRGEVELAVQQVSELMIVSGIDVVGAFPAGAESVTMFSGGVLARSAQFKLAGEFLAHLRTVQAKQALIDAGLRPAA